MIQQIAFLLFLYLMGLGIQLPLSRRIGPAFWAIAAFPVGHLLWVTVLVFSLMIRLPLTFGSAVTMTAAVFVGRASLALRKGWRPRRADIIAAAGMFLSLALTGMIAGVFDFSTLSADSIMVSYLGRMLAQRGGFHWAMNGILPDWGIYTVLAQAASVWLGSDYVSLIQPFLAVSVVALVAWGIHRSLNVGADSATARALVVALLGAAMVATSMFFAFNAVFIHNAMPATCYTLLAFSAFWLTEDAEEGAWTGIGWVGLWGVVLSRPEGPVIATLIAVSGLSARPFSRRPMLQWAGGVFLLTVIWYVQLAAMSDDSSQVMSPARALMTTAPLLAVVILSAIGAGKLDWLRRYSGSLMMLGSAVALGYALITYWKDMEISLKWVAVNLLYTGRWGFSTISLAASLPLAILIGAKIRREKAFAVFLVTYPLLILLMGSMRSQYRHGWGDTANRMFLHLFPVAILYLAVKLGPLLARKPDPAAKRT